MYANVLQLSDGGDFEALHCQPSTNFDRSTKLDLTTEPPLLGRCCYSQYFLSYYVYKVLEHFGKFISSCSIVIVLFDLSYLFSSHSRPKSFKNKFFFC